MIQKSAATLFHFACAHCQHPNEHREIHRQNVSPFLVSKKCAFCGKLNWLGGLSGTKEEVVLSSDTLETPCATQSAGGSFSNEPR